jgi:uncharacterized membrane protein YebE (DUF533 family)
MSFGDILGQMLQDGLGGQTQTRERLSNTAQNLGQGGGALDQIFGQFQGALGRAGVDTGGMSQAAGGFAEKAQDFLRKDQVGGLSGAQIGGIGALAGALLGGGLGGAARGGAMAVLGTLAVGALRRAQARAEAGGGDAGASVPTAEVEALTGPETEKLLVRAMISAAKADGQIDQAEMEKVIGRISGGSVTPEEKQFVLDEMQAPLDVQALAAGARTPEQAAEVYAASLLAIDIDSDRERQYLTQLAQALRLDTATQQELHRLTGVPA